MADIVEWLQKLGLEKYQQTFLDSEIDLEVLPELTDADLKDLSVPLGPRKKILRAIANAASDNFALGKKDAATETASTVVPTSQAERRHLTVMFCDLVGSTQLSEQFDPEDLSQLIRQYHSFCKQIIESYHGFIARYMGDGILVYFGYPLAQEDDAQRAVDAGLELCRRISDLETIEQQQLQLRVGIASGLVVVGEIVGQGQSEERTVVGETPNMAARLQGYAPANGVVIGSSTRRLIGSSYTFEELGQHEIRGFSQQLDVFQVTGKRWSDSRFVAAGRDVMPIVGREDEIGKLNLKWKSCCAGSGGAVMLCGEAGIGKSRLTEAFYSSIRKDDHTRLTFQCSQHFANTALYPIITLIERMAEFNIEDNDEARLTKLETIFCPSLSETLTPDIQRTMSVVAALFAVSTTRYPAHKLNPQQLKLASFDILFSWLRTMCKSSPLYCIFEDLHWSDPTSLEFLTSIKDEIDSLSLLLVCTFRPEIESPWQETESCSLLQINKLDSSQTLRLIQNVIENKRDRQDGRNVVENTADAGLPTNVLEQIAAKTDGIPLFVEELTKTVMESGLLIEEGAGYRATGPVENLAIPSTLQDSLMARLDRLNAVKEIAQIGASIGREFSFKLIREVSAIDDADLVDALSKLDDAELTSHRGVLPEATYVFKHALVQDAAYESLLKSQRLVIHRQIAEAMRDQFPILGETEPETIAYHFTAAGKTEEAAGWWTKAGNIAAGRGGSVEALGHFEQAIALADTLSQTPERTRARLELQVAYREALILVHGWGDERTTGAFRRSTEIAEQIDEPEQRLASAFGDWLATYIPGGGTKCLPIAESYLRQAKEIGGSAEILTGERILGESCWCTGDFVGAIAATERSLSIYDYDKHSFLIKQIGSDAKAMLLSFRASSLWPAGRLEEARQVADESIAHGRWTEDAPSLGFALGIVCLLEAARTDLNRLEKIATELLKLSEQNDMIFWKVQAQMWLAATRSRTSSVPDCIVEFRQHMDTLSDMMMLFHPVATGVLVDLEIQNDPENALLVLDEYLATTAQSGLSWFDAELHRRRGLCLRRITPTNFDSAAVAFEAARKIARAQGARTYDLLACRDLVHLHDGSGKQNTARAQLEEALAGFTDNPEFPAIAESRQLLSSLVQVS